MSADREKVEVRRRDVDITSELFRLQRQKGRRAMAWDVTFELVRASVGAPDSDRYRLVTQKVIEEIVRHLGEVAPETERRSPVSRPHWPTRRRC